MSFFHGRARQPEIIRTVQKDLLYTNELTTDLSNILRLTGTRTWIRYNHLCRLISEIIYHGFASIHNLQTLGEEYTGIIQVDSKFISLPSKVLQLTSIVLEFGGDILYIKVLQKLENELMQNSEILPDAKEKLYKIILFMKAAIPYIKGFHKSIFYLGSTKYQLSKRLTGINYVLVRHWLQPSYSLYGYKVLGVVTLCQLVISAIYHMQEYATKDRFSQIVSEKKTLPRKTTIEKNKTVPCSLCLEPRQQTSLTTCGHLFCWDCILDWLDEREECPICREKIKKSNVVQLQNYS